EGLRDAGSDPVGRLVIEMIGEPRVRRGGSILLPFLYERRRLPRPFIANFRLPRRVAAAVIASKFGGKRDVKSGALKRRKKQAAHAPIARGDGVIRGFHRRIEGKLHDPPVPSRRGRASS